MSKKPFRLDVEPPNLTQMSIWSEDEDCYADELIERLLEQKQKLLVREVAKAACFRSSVIGERALYNKLREWGIIQHNTTLPTQRAMRHKLCDEKYGVHMTMTGLREHRTTLITPQGQAVIIRLLKEEGFYEPK